MKTYIVTLHYNCHDKMVLIMESKVCFNGEIWIIVPKLSLLLFLSGALQKYSIDEIFWYIWNSYFIINRCLMFNFIHIKWIQLSVVVLNISSSGLSVVMPLPLKKVCLERQGRFRPCCAWHSVRIIQLMLEQWMEMCMCGKEIILTELYKLPIR